jgi:hypothetical protein
MKEYIQKKKGHTLKFKLNEDELVYSLKTSTSDSTTPIPYKNMSANTWTFIEKNDWYRNVGALWILLGLAFEIPQIFLEKRFSLPFWFLLGVLFLLIYYIQKIKFTVIDADGNRIFIINDNQHDEIYNAILKYRRESLKREFGEINYNNDLNAEINKFSYLLNDGIISEKEFSEIKLTLEKHHKDKPILSNFF